MDKNPQNIILGVSGSIAAYKSFDLLRGLIKRGHQVKVVATAGAKKFINLELFKHLGAQSVYGPEDDFNNQGVLHVQLARWADQVIFCPASANSLALMAHGQATDLLTSIFLAGENLPWTIYPAMNPSMYAHPLSQLNRQTLRGLSNVRIIEPAAGKMACMEEGIGRLPEISTILTTYDIMHQDPSGLKVLLTTGATIAPIDAVRYITNPSSGLSGLYLAKEALKRGHEVIVIAGPHATKKLERLQVHERFQLKRITTTREMLSEVERFLPSIDIYLSPAAISDFEFTSCDQKIKKNGLTELSPLPAPDILAKVLALRSLNQKVVGFAAESDLSDTVINEKLERKPVDFLVGTLVQNGYQGKNREGFKENHATYKIYKKRELLYEGAFSKEAMATFLFDQLDRTES